jgi:hypothetical protein
MEWNSIRQTFGSLWSAIVCHCMQFADFQGNSAKNMTQTSVIRFQYQYLFVWKMSNNYNLTEFNVILLFLLSSFLLQNQNLFSWLPLFVSGTALPLANYPFIFLITFLTFLIFLTFLLLLRSSLNRIISRTEQF